MGRGSREDDQSISLETRKPTSMSTLIVWNVTKALENKPDIDLRSAIKAAQERLEQDPLGATTAASSQCPVERHLACALLAWQQLGHNNAESLHQFILTSRSKENLKKEITMGVSTKRSYAEALLNSENKESDNLKYLFDMNRKCTAGPVVKLPTETVVMRLDNTPSRQTPGARQPPKKIKVPDRDLITKIDAACCLDTDCVARLSELDTATKEMRLRAARLARREAERVELLERAEAAWKDLEIGYQRRLTLAVEKEEDMQKQIQKMIEERNGFKEACINLAQQLKSKGEAAEKDRKRLTLVEKDVCDRACMRLRLSEEAARGDATLAEHHCRAAQLERDLQFKEEQARRKLTTMEHELESTRTLTLEAERAMRAELGAIRDQIAQISDQLISEDNDNAKIKNELEELRKEKLEMIEDLEGCKTTCDNRMQGKADELKKKRDQLLELKKKVLECRCKAPVDATVEVKRTPSLAALCHCTPEDKVLQSCSCTSLRTQLLSNMLGDLFGGLQSELGGCGAQMPCQLLKCLEDKHNWDRASIVKTNLRNYFSQLLIGELDIAIATAIEKYHAKWVGASCADEARLIPDPGEVENEGWQERALERKAQKLAEKLAEQLFKERSEQLMQKAKDIVKAGPPPCECKQPGSPNPSVTRSDKSTEKGSDKVGEKSGVKNIDNGAVTIAPMYWHRTQRDVTQLRVQIENLEKESLKKEDLRSMEEKIVKIVQRASGPDKAKATTSDNYNEESNKREQKNNKNLHYQDFKGFMESQKPNTFTKKRQVDTNIVLKKSTKNTLNQSSTHERIVKTTKRPGQSYAVNVCLCAQKDPKKIVQQENQMQNSEGAGVKASIKQKSPKEISSQISSIRQSKPISMHISSKIGDLDTTSKTSPDISCKNDCVCFHKVPSNTSIDKLLETLAKWKSDLTECLENNENDVKINKISSNKISSSIKTMPKSQEDSQLSGIHSNLGNIDNLGESKDALDSPDPIDEDVSKSIGFEHNTPVSKESEYMGAINLDKSNENSCKCNVDAINKNTNDARTGDSRFRVKCINSDACNCKEILKNQSSELSKSQKLNIITLEQNNNTLPIQNNIITKESSNLDTLRKEKNSNVNNKEVNETNSDIDEIVKQELLLPCDCDYNIQFLGVTLVDMHNDDVTKDTDKNKSGNKISQDIQSDPRKKMVSNGQNASNLNKRNDLTAQSKLTEKRPCANTLACECNIHFDEFKKILNQNFNNNQRKTRSTNQDKALDVQSLKGLAEKQDCVCCDSYKVDESKDLELNAFYLLEEHLKKKLAEFKLSTCKSSCIPADEEEKLFSAILERVKKVITDSTNKLMCKCLGDQQNLGSWNRAYGLLQEYLKIKIKRVQCLCVSPEDPKDEILPDVLDKVCNLIENDFHRLQSICTCNNENLAEKNVRFQNKAAFEVPVKDTSNSNTVKESNRGQSTNDKMLCKENSNTSIIDTQNISSQVPPNLGMETKSCDAIKNGTKDIQTSNKDLNIRSDGCDCVYSASIQKNEPFLELFGTNQVFINRCTDFTKSSDIKTNNPIETVDNTPFNVPVKSIVQKVETHVPKVEEKENNEEIKIDVKKSTLPYIGYTIDCTCDRSLGSCICTKSIVQANNDKIQSIWKTYTDNTCINDATYIMNGPNKIKYNYNDNNFIPIPDEMEKKYKIICETQVSTSNGEDLVLKQSPKNLPNTSKTTNTFDDVSIETDYSNNEDPLDWYECGSQMHKAPPITEKEDLTNSLYFPANLPKSHKRAKSEVYLDKDALKLPNSLSMNCDCDAVPICHVKLLVDNIENKLLNSMCTCDSLVPKVCPVHSKNPVVD